ncbi:Fic family protein [Candidatus Gracilibacteria bacterium]|nr:Fic family protein [Candidatus Gracilibacteria bacterium]
MPRPNVKNKEWLSLLEEESRNSLMIEGYFVSKRELKQALKTRKSAHEVVGYFDAAQQSYEMAYEQFRENEFQLSKSLIRQIHSVMFRDVPYFRYPRGEWRNEPIIISGAKCMPPKDRARIEQILEKLIFLINKKKMEPWRRAALAHATFELAHPFPDGNGRVGRILASFILVAHGLPNIIIKGDEEAKKNYFDSLESADKTIDKLFRGQIAWTKIPIENFLPLEYLIKTELANSLDKLICAAWKKQGGKLLPTSTVAKQTSRKVSSFQVQCYKKQFISIKEGGHILTHPDLLIEPK